MNEVSVNLIKAQELDRKIKVSAQLAQQSLFEMCVAFKEMRDSKLYKELGYTDFREYCENETGFKHSQIYSYIAIYEKLPEDFVQSTGQIGVQKLYLLTTISDSERADLIENIDIENTSVRKLEEEIKLLKEENKKISQEAEEKMRLEGRIKSLEAQIKEIENRPIDVAVEDNSKQLQELRAQLDAEKQQALKEAKASSEKEISSLKTQLQTVSTKMQEQSNNLKVDEDKIKFKDLYAFAFDAIKRLIDFTNGTGNDFYKSKVKELANVTVKSIQE